MFWITKTNACNLQRHQKPHLRNALAEFPGRIRCRYLQKQQTQAVGETSSYQTKIKLNQQSLEELKWWKIELKWSENSGKLAILKSWRFKRMEIEP